jgi:hypothetical protein
VKVIASILVFYFCVLMVQPFVNIGLGSGDGANICHPHDMCCRKKMKHEGHKDQNTACNRDFCNPFVPCGISIAQPVPVHSFSDVALEAPKKLKPAINEDIISAYLSDCWRPPEQLS